MRHNSWMESLLFYGFAILAVGISLHRTYLYPEEGTNSVILRAFFLFRQKFYDHRNSYAESSLFPSNPATTIYSDVYTSSSSSSSSSSSNNYIDKKGSKESNKQHIPPYAFAVLRESVLAVGNGAFVHPDLGIMKPGPQSGADRGIGMVRDSYQNCQVEQCDSEDNGILLKIPLNAQMTRNVAMKTLSEIIPLDVQQKKPLTDLDDAALLVLLLAHEKAIGKDSRFVSYIMNLPKEPSCGYSPDMRKKVIDMVAIYSDNYSADVNGWPAEISKAGDYAERIASSLANDYGAYLKVPSSKNIFKLMNWSLCTVASRATGGSKQYGSLRLVPILDMINHDINAGGFIELLGHERKASGDFIDATESDAGTFIVRSVKDGKPYPLKKGMELLANYNVPSYSPLDWFLNLGFVPPERQVRWTMLETALPKLTKHR